MFHLYGEVEGCSNVSKMLQVVLLWVYPTVVDGDETSVSSLSSFASSS